jgi:hypothetical protein
MVSHNAMLLEGYQRVYSGFPKLSHCLRNGYLLSGERGIPPANEYSDGDRPPISIQPERFLMKLATMDEVIHAATDACAATVYRLTSL